MEEAEALSTKLAIMVEGKIKCIGPVQSLKNKYGKGFEIETKLNLPSEEEIKKIVEMSELPHPITNNNNVENSEQNTGIDINIDMEQIEQALTKIQKQHYLEKITSIGEGSSIFNEV